MKTKDTQKDLKTQAVNYVVAIDEELLRPNRMVDLDQYGGVPKDKLEAFQQRKQKEALPSATENTRTHVRTGVTSNT